MTATQDPSIDLRTGGPAGAGPSPEDQPVAVTRRRIDRVLISLGAVVTVVMFVAAGLLFWGNRFATNYVSDELSAQKISFPSQAQLESEGRSDLVGFADQQVTTGPQAEAYAGYIAGHVDKTSGGKTYAELGGPQMAAQKAVDDAKASGASDAEVAPLQATATKLTQQRDTVFKGEMLRGTLLNAYAWSTIGRIAGIAAIVAAIGGIAMAVFVILGLIHLRRNPQA